MTDDRMGQGDRMGTTGAVWCDQHERWECSKNSKRSKVRCHALAIRGLDRCFSHAGERTELAKAKGEAITAWSALTGKPTVQTAEAVLGMLQMSWMRVHLYAGLLEEQFTRAQAQRAARGAGGEGDGGGSGSRGAGPVGPGVGLIGHTFSAVKDEGIYATGEAARGLTQLEAAERDRCVRFAKVAHDMGIAEQQVQLAQQQGQMLAQVVRRVADGLLAALLALLADVPGREDDAGTDPAGGRFTETVTAAVRTAWPEWIREIAPRELRAIQEGTHV